MTLDTWALTNDELFFVSAHCVTGPWRPFVKWFYDFSLNGMNMDTEAIDYVSQKDFLSDSYV